VPLHVPAMHLNHAGKENGEQGNEENDVGKDVLVGEISHKWQPCSTADDTVVKSRLSQSTSCF
jgi:hypothetical protein